MKQLRYIKNPVLKGFNPDPSIVRVDDNYYVATSTFEWFPGVQIHQSTDLINWQLVGQALNRISQLNLIGVPDSCGVWAPCLSYDEGTFYLVYTNVRSFDGPWKDTPNYLVTSNNIEGPWSEPYFITARGFDGSLFHDKDGRKWFTNMVVDHRNGKFFGGIQLQEWCPVKRKLIGDVYVIFEGTSLGCTEGPHIYNKNGWYYLITAEGGTEYNHAISVARSRYITGPYEVHPDNPIFTAKDHPDYLFQRTGHGDLFESKDGKWYISYLASRPILPARRCTLGRETVIEEIIWKDDWPYSVNGDKKTRELVPIFSTELSAPSINQLDDEFNSAALSPVWQSLRIPIENSWASLTERQGFLRLYGRESLSSTHYQSLIARRLESFSVEASCHLEFHPKNYQQLAGLVCYYNTSHYIYCYVSICDSDKNKNQLKIIVNDNGIASEPKTNIVIFSKNEPVLIKAIWIKDKIQFYFSLPQSDIDWNLIGPVLDGSILSDDYVRDGGNKYRAAFTGAFIGICCQDLTGEKLHADFDWFHYKEANL